MYACLSVCLYVSPFRRPFVFLSCNQVMLQATSAACCRRNLATLNTVASSRLHRGAKPRQRCLISSPIFPVLSVPLCREWNKGSYFTADNHQLTTVTNTLTFISSSVCYWWCSWTVAITSEPVCNSSRSPFSVYSELRPVTGPPNGPVLFCSLTSVVCRRRL